MSRIRQGVGRASGGVVGHVTDVVETLKASGEDVLVAAPEGEFPSSIHQVPLAIGARPSREDVGAIARLRGIMKGADAVHAHGLRAGAFAVLAGWGMRRRPRIVVTEHNLPVGGRAVRAIGWTLETIVARGADCILGVSPDLVERARTLGARDADLALVPAPKRRGDADVSRDPQSLLTIARLAPQKGLDLALDAAGILARDGYTFSWSIAGDGPEGDHLAQRIRDEKLPVTLLGRRDDIATLLARCGIVVQASLWEGQPLSIQEALAAGCAIVATDVGGTRAVTGDAARLVAPDGAALAQAIASLLDRPEDAEDLRKRARTRFAELPQRSDVLAQLRACYALGE